MRTFAYLMILLLAAGVAGAQIDVPSDAPMASIDTSDPTGRSSKRKSNILQVVLRDLPLATDWRESVE